MTATRIDIPQIVGHRRSIRPVRDDVPNAAVVVPVKAFADAKQRLRSVLDDEQRRDVARWCAARVLAAAAPLPAYVVCDDAGVATWAESTGAGVIVCEGAGLNPAIEVALRSLRDRGIDFAVIAHGDLPLATGFAHLPLDGFVTLVPDHRYDGTNVLVVPTGLAGRFTFQYGHGSFRRHVHEALACGVDVRVVRDGNLAHDLDTPTDLADPRMEDVRRWLQTNQANPR
jgi:2-phospho-L-lactate guanylyltransferase